MESIKDDTLTELNALAEAKNAFPLQSFPKRLQEIVLDMESTLGFPKEYTGASALFAASLAIGHTHRVRVKKGFEMSPILWIVNVGKSGTTKSHPMKIMLKPFFKKDDEAKKRFDDAMKKYDLDSENKEIDKKDLIKPVQKKFIEKDFTIEKLAKRMLDNMRGIGCFFDEITSFTNNFDRYSKGSQEQVWLSLFDGDGFDFSRVNGDTRTAHSFVPILGSTQIKSLHKFAANDRIHTGFLDRFLISLNENDKAARWTDNELSDATEIDYNSIIENLICIETLYGIDIFKPTIVDFEPSAKKMLKDWQHQNAAFLDIAGESERGIRAKIQTNVPRIALILHLLEYACNESKYNTQIKSETLDKAIILGEYFIACAKKAYSIITGEPLKNPEKELLETQIWELHLEGYKESGISKMIYGDNSKRVQVGRILDKLKETKAQNAKTEPLKVVKKAV